MVLMNEGLLLRAVFFAFLLYKTQSPIHKEWLTPGMGYSMILALECQE